MKLFFRIMLLQVAVAFALSAATVSFQGTFASSTDLQFFTFTTSGGSSVRTLSYGGGTAIPAGGFDPLLTLFDVSGNPIGAFDNSAGGTPCVGGIAEGTNGCLDAYIGSVAAGTYTVALTQFDNILNGSVLSDGFLSSNLCTAGFCDAFDQTTARTGDWTIQFISVDSVTEITATPEPGTLFPMVPGLAICGLLRRKSRKARLPGSDETVAAR